MAKDYPVKNEDKWKELVNELIKEVKYGNITLIIQDGKVIQIDKTEKVRL